MAKVPQTQFLQQTTIKNDLQKWANDAKLTRHRGLPTNALSIIWNLKNLIIVWVDFPSLVRNVPGWSQKLKTCSSKVGPLLIAFYQSLFAFKITLSKKVSLLQLYIFKRRIMSEFKSWQDNQNLFRAFFCVDSPRWQAKACLVEHSALWSCSMAKVTSTGNPLCVSLKSIYPFECILFHQTEKLAFLWVTLEYEHSCRSRWAFSRHLEHIDQRLMKSSWSHFWRKIPRLPVCSNRISVHSSPSLSFLFFPWRSCSWTSERTHSKSVLCQFFSPSVPIRRVSSLC